MTMFCILFPSGKEVSSPFLFLTLDLPAPPLFQVGCWFATMHLHCLLGISYFGSFLGPVPEYTYPLSVVNSIAMDIGEEPICTFLQIFLKLFCACTCTCTCMYTCLLLINKHV